MNNANTKWLLYWTILSISAPLVSFIGGYGYFYVLALLYPLAQTIALSKIPHAKNVWLWMLHFGYWILLIEYSTTYKFTFAGILVSSCIGQFLLYFILGSFGKFRWFMYNTLGLSLLVIEYYSIKEVQISNDFLEIIVVIGLSFSCAFLSGLGIKKGYLNNENTTLP